MVVEVGCRSTTELGAAHYTVDVLEVVQRLLGGDGAQWPALIAEVHSLAIAICEKRPAASDSDFANNVALRVIERLKKENYRALHRFLALRESYPDLEFEKWTRGIINNAAIDEIRSQPDVARARAGKGRELRSRAHVAFEDENHVDVRSTVSFALDARRVLRWIRDENFPEEQRRALLLWLSGHTVDDCSEELGLDAGSTRRCLQAARQRLRRQFKEKSE